MSKSSCCGTVGELRPIGIVRSVEGDVSEIVVRPDLEEGLYRLDDNREVLILFFFDRSEGFDLKVHPRGDPSEPLVGVFATRSPRRPNQIGVTSVRLLSVKGNVLTVEGLDAWEGTPVLDIKPVRRRDELHMGEVRGKTN
ncbi:MAG: S-adenosyl-L-methionine-binding protein [Methanomassiliicoccales archaeon PtaU1.Bin030]|nr:MAG: S-adenosyl-L-methionine-binding protein [Methanomassiliicoccales archaeon PtaU1.Bin030]